MKQKTRVYVTLMLVIAMLGTCYVYADSDSKDPQRVGTVTTYFNANGGSCYPDFTSNTIGSTYGSVPTPTKYGWVFIGWFPDSIHETYEVTVNSIVPNTDRTLYAHWSLQIEITNVASYKNLNINGSGLTSLNNGRNITVYTSSGSNEQRWYDNGLNTQVYIRSKVDKTYGLNVYRSGSPWNCNVHKIIGNETDAQVDYIQYGNHYRIKLHNYNLYLTADGSADGDNVYWAAYTNSNYQLWDSGVPTLGG